MQRFIITLFSLLTFSLGIFSSARAMAYVNVSYSNYGYGWNWGLSHGSRYGYYSSPYFFRPVPVLSNFRTYRANIEVMALLRARAEAQRLVWLESKRSVESRVVPEVIEPELELLPLDVPSVKSEDKIVE